MGGAGREEQAQLSVVDVTGDLNKKFADAPL
jgi:hypothetical protein